MARYRICPRLRSAWSESVVEPDGDGAIVRQTALFDPRGLLGLAYWYALYPVHKLVFAGMLRGIVRANENDTAGAVQEVVL